MSLPVMVTVPLYRLHGAFPFALPSAKASVIDDSAGSDTTALAFVKVSNRHLVPIKSGVWGVLQARRLHKKARNKRSERMTVVFLCKDN